MITEFDGQWFVDGLMIWLATHCLIAGERFIDGLFIYSRFMRGKWLINEWLVLLHHWE